VSGLIDTAWRSYAERVIPAGAPDVQRIECRRAFYAGARAYLTAMLKFLDPGEEPTGADIALLDGVSQELNQFVRDVEEGRA
jgi:hypothetical protein